MTLSSRHISLSINRPASEVYAFASKPENMPKWASGLSGSIKKEADHWIAESPMGRVKITVAEPNKFGIIDHDVTIASGEVFHNPLRVIDNGQGAEVVFTLFRHPKVSDQDYERDAATVLKDLGTLKSLLEK